MAEYANLINSFKHAAEFLAKIYEADKHFDKIKNLIDSRSNIWNFDKLIKPLLNVYPHYCFRKIAAMTYETLNTERGRSIYETNSQMVGFDKTAARHATGCDDTDWQNL